MRSLTIDTSEKSDNSRALTDNNRQMSSRKKGELSRKNFNFKFFHKREKLLFLSVVSSAQRQATVAGTTGLPAQYLSPPSSVDVSSKCSQNWTSITLFFMVSRAAKVLKIYEMFWCFVILWCCMLLSRKKKSEFLVSSSVRWNLIVFTRDKYNGCLAIWLKSKSHFVLWCEFKRFCDSEKNWTWFGNSDNFSPWAH